MLTFKNMRLEVYRRENGEGMVALLAEQPTVGLDADAADKAAFDEGRYGVYTAGIRYLSFYFTREEFDGLLSGKLGAVNDCSHNVRAIGESFTFYDLEFSRETRGRLNVPYVNVHIPRYVARVLARAVRVALARCEPGGKRAEISISWENRDRWSRQYGQGTGRVMLAVADVGDTVEFFDKCEREGGETFKRCIENLRSIGRNTTWRHTDIGVVKLSKDWDGFYFRILRPDGGCTLNGGVINHGRDGEHDWSTHT